VATSSEERSFAQAQLPTVLEADQHARRSVFQRGTFVGDAQSPGRHQVDEEGEVAELDHRHLRDPAHAGDLASHQRFERRIEGLHHVHPRRQHRFHRGATDRFVDPSRGDLDLRQLGHS
jgi:hypothetical protein